MKQLKKLTAIIFLCCAAPLLAQDNTSPSGGKEPPQDEEIGELHKKLADLVSEYIGEEEKEKLELNMGIGMHKTGGRNDHPVYEEKITIELSSGTPTSLTIDYHETTSKSLITQTRTLINPNLRSDDLGNLQIKYTSSMDDPANFNLRDLHSERSQLEILSYYKKKLNETIRHLTTHIYARKRMERFTVDKILLLGQKE